MYTVYVQSNYTGRYLCKTMTTDDMWLSFDFGPGRDMSRDVLVANNIDQWGWETYDNRTQKRYDQNQPNPNGMYNEQQVL